MSSPIASPPSEPTPRSPASITIDAPSTAATAQGTDPPSSTQQQPLLSTTFPPPPPYYAHYTDANLQVQAERRRVMADGNDATTIPPALQAQLSCIPVLDPPPPLTESHTLFGTTFSPRYLRPTLASGGFPTLVTTVPQQDTTTTDGHIINGGSKQLIRRLIISAAFSYSRLMRQLATDPGSSVVPDMNKQLETILVNAVHVLGNYREHQALRTIQLAMNKTLWDSHRTIEIIHASVTASRALIHELITEDPWSNAPEYLSVTQAAMTPRKGVATCPFPVPPILREEAMEVDGVPSQPPIAPSTPQPMDWRAVDDTVASNTLWNLITSM